MTAEKFILIDGKYFENEKSQVAKFTLTFESYVNFDVCDGGVMFTIHRDLSGIKDTEADQEITALATSYFARQMFGAAAVAIAKENWPFEEKLKTLDNILAGPFNFPTTENIQVTDIIEFLNNFENLKPDAVESATAYYFDK